MGWWSTARATTMVIKLMLDIDRIIEERGDYQRIILIGHSMGGVLGRRLFLLAAGIPPGFGARRLSPATRLPPARGQP